MLVMSYIDSKVLVLLRDGRTLIGYLRSVDQFANLVLHQSIERIHVNDMFGDIQRGIFIIRGENVNLIGEIDKEREENLGSKLREVSVEEILDAQRKEIEARHEKSLILKMKLKERGLNLNNETNTEDF